jgi:hypothetical protein
MTLQERVEAVGIDKAAVILGRTPAQLRREIAAGETALNRMRVIENAADRLVAAEIAKRGLPPMARALIAVADRYEDDKDNRELVREIITEAAVPLFGLPNNVLFPVVRIKLKELAAVSDLPDAPVKARANGAPSASLTERLDKLRASEGGREFNGARIMGELGVTGTTVGYIIQSALKAGAIERVRRGVYRFVAEGE